MKKKTIEKMKKKTSQKIRNWSKKNFINILLFFPFYFSYESYILALTYFFKIF